MKKQRPVNLDLASMKYPPMAIVSILHRITGIVLFLALPFILYLLAQSLPSQEGFVATQGLLATPYWKCLLWIFSAAYSYHLLAGLRHMIMDTGVGEGLRVSRMSAVVVLVVAAVVTFLLGLWIW